MNGLAAYGSDIVIALDDLHKVTDGDCLTSIRYALTQLPPGVRVIAMTRTDPRLRLSRLVRAAISSSSEPATLPSRRRRRASWSTGASCVASMPTR